MSEPRESQLIENVPLDGDTNEARQALKNKKATTPGNPRPSTSKHQDTSPAPDISEPERPNCGQNKRKVNSREVVSEQEPVQKRARSYHTPQWELHSDFHPQQVLPNHQQWASSDGDILTAQGVTAYNIHISPGREWFPTLLLLAPLLSRDYAAILKSGISTKERHYTVSERAALSHLP